jgi:hypothetical protein
MLLNNETKRTIREKFNITKNPFNTETSKKQKIKSNKGTKTNNVDDIYTVDHIVADGDIDVNVENSTLDYYLPQDRNISNILPNIENLVETDYKPIKKEYIYNIKLEKGFPSSKKNIKIVIYHINNFNSVPFILYLLYKFNLDEDPLEHLSLLEIQPGEKDLKTFSKNIVKEIIFKDYTQKPKYKGYREYKNYNYLFFEYSPKKDEVIGLVNRDTNWIWTVVDEIINLKTVLNFPIKDTTCDFFINNLDLISIYTKDKITTFETPVIAYHGNYYKKIHFIYVFGISRSSRNSSLGPFYYFASYASAVSYAIFANENDPTVIDEKSIIDENGKYEKGGLVRFVVFTGKTKIIDENNANKTIIKNVPMSSWSMNYNSAFIGKYSIYNNKKILNVQPKFAIKQYEQQVSLTYHYINTSTDETDFEKIKIE